jgi:NADP-dependent 3-hydroxy acid dehydrogenase YdfG
MAGKLESKVALVTGASSGIGEATALALAAEGARVALAARRTDRLEDLVSRIKASGGEAFAIAADISDEAQAHQAVQSTYEHWNQLDILVNNAGVMLLSPISEANSADWRQMININLLGLMYTTQATIAIMKAQGGGHIVNLSSVAGRVANPNAAVYAATKFGVGAFSEGLRREVYKDKIRITLIEPGSTVTELLDHITNPTTKSQSLAMAGTMNRLQATDIAAAIVYAVSQPAHVNVNEILIRPTEQER